MTDVELLRPLEDPAPLHAGVDLPGQDRIERNGFARLGDLESPGVVRTLLEMERFQLEFMAATRGLWTPEFPFTGDCLYGWSRRWEYPYGWSHLPRGRGAHVLDAGSGITFLPFYLERAGLRVSCADPDATLAPAFERAKEAMQSSIDFRISGIERLEWPDRAFDGVACLSVLEHVPKPARGVEELARVLRPGGRLVLTWDVSLSRDHEILMEDAAVLISSLGKFFTAVYPWNLLRLSDLLTTDRMLPAEAWRLPWRRPGNGLRRWFSALRQGKVFRSLTVMGSVWDRKN